MPPKAQQISIQLKREKTTFIVSLKQSDSLKVNEIKKQLVSIIESVGGLSLEDNDDDDIDIPIPTFGDDSDSDDDIKVESQLKEGNIIPTLDEITIGKPIDINDAFNDKFKDVSNDEKLQLKEFQVLAFRINEEPFNVVQDNADD